MRKIMFFTVLLMSITICFDANSTIVRPLGEPDPSTVKAAITELRSLSGKEKRERVREAKKVLREYKKDKKAGRSGSVEKVVLIILAILLPPLAVYLHQGEINGKFWLSILLWLLFILPGIIYALLVVLDEV